MSYQIKVIYPFPNIDLNDCILKDLKDKGICFIENEVNDFLKDEGFQSVKFLVNFKGCEKIPFEKEKVYFGHFELTSGNFYPKFFFDEAKENISGVDDLDKEKFFDTDFVTEISVDGPCGFGSLVILFFICWSMSSVLRGFVFFHDDEKNTYFLLPPERFGDLVLEKLIYFHNNFFKFS